MEDVGKKTGNIFDIQRFSTHDGPGIRTVVFLKGCSMRCLWCSNPESQKKSPDILFQENTCIGCQKCLEACAYNISMGMQGVGEGCVLCKACVKACPSKALTVKGEYLSIKEIVDEVKRDEAYYSTSGGGVTISGGEPLEQSEFTAMLIDALKVAGFHIALETAGNVPWEIAKEIFKRADLLLYDVKHMDPYKHQIHTGVPNEQILENLKLCAQQKYQIVIRIPLIKEFNTDIKNMTAVADMAIQLGITHIDLLPYHSLAEIKYKKMRQDYLFRGGKLDEDEIDKIKELLENRGMVVSIGG